MAYDQAHAAYRVALKRNLRRLGVTGWKNEDPTPALEAKARHVGIDLNGCKRAAEIHMQEFRKKRGF